LRIQSSSSLVLDLMDYQDLINPLRGRRVDEVLKLEIDDLLRYYLLEGVGRGYEDIQYRTSLGGFGRLEVELRGMQLDLLGYMICSLAFFPYSHFIAGEGHTLRYNKQ
jgi:hypothetical protein